MHKTRRLVKRLPENAPAIVDGSLKGFLAALVGLAVAAGCRWLLQVYVGVVDHGALSFWAIQYLVGGGVFGFTLGRSLDAERVGAASLAAGAVLVVGTGTAALFAAFFLFPLTGGQYLLAAALLAVPITRDRRAVVIIAAVAAGWALAFALWVPLATIWLSPADLEPLAVLLPGVQELVDTHSFASYALFYPYVAPATLPVIAACYGAGLRAVETAPTGV